MALFPRTLKQAVEKAANPILKKRGFSEARIISDWEQIVGATLAQHCLPIRMQFARGQSTDGTLTLSTHPAYAPELQQLLPQIREKIAVYFGYRAIERIVIEHAYRPLPTASEPIRAAKPFAITTHSDDPLTAALERLEAARQLKE